MFDLGWTEMLLIGIVALIVVGPKDLPQMFRTVGRFTGKAKAMAREFTKAMNDAADQSGMREIDKTIRAASNPAKFGTDSLKKAAGMGPQTRKLSEERAEVKRKVTEATARKAEERLAREAAMAEEEADGLLLDDDIAPVDERPVPAGAVPDPAAPAPAAAPAATAPATEPAADAAFDPTTEDATPETRRK